MNISSTLKVVFLFCVFQFNLYAGGTLRSSMFGAKASALNGIYTAGLDNLSNVYLNPAGLSYIENKTLHLSGFLRSEENTFVGSRGLYRSILEDDLNFAAGFAYPLSTNFTTAIAYESQSEYKVNWPYVLLYRRGTTQTTAASDMINQVTQKIITGSASYKLEDLAIGVSFNFINQENQFAFPQSNPQWLNNIGIPQYQVNLNFDEWVWYLNLGILYQFTNQLRAGIKITNGFEKTFSGKALSTFYAVTDSASDNVDVEMIFSSPWRLAGGILYQFTDNIGLNLDFRYNLYSSTNDEISFNYTDPIWQRNSRITDTVTGFSLSAIPLYLKNSFDAGLGLNFQINQTLTLFAGYKYTSSPNTERTYSLLFPEVNTQTFSAGFGYQDEDMLIEGSIAFYIGVERDINNSLSPIHKGTYDGSGAIPMLSVTFKL